MLSHNRKSYYPPDSFITPKFVLAYIAKTYIYMIYSWRQLGKATTDLLVSLRTTQYHGVPFPLSLEWFFPFIVFHFLSLGYHLDRHPAWEFSDFTSQLPEPMVDAGL